MLRISKKKGRIRRKWLLRIVDCLSLYSSGAPKVSYSLLFPPRPKVVLVAEGGGGERRKVFLSFVLFCVGVVICRKSIALSLLGMASFAARRHLHA